MSINREAIYAALFNLLQSRLNGSIVTIGRRHTMPPDLSPAQQPALFCCSTSEEKDPRPRGTPGKLTLRATIFLYCYDSGLNPLECIGTCAGLLPASLIRETRRDAVHSEHFSSRVLSRSSVRKFHILLSSLDFQGDPGRKLTTDEQLAALFPQLQD
jgi:hypothetical protein